MNCFDYDWKGWGMIFNATFNNISVIPWQAILLDSKRYKRLPDVTPNRMVLDVSILPDANTMIQQTFNFNLIEL